MSKMEAKNTKCISNPKVKNSSISSVTSLQGQLELIPVRPDLENEGSSARRQDPAPLKLSGRGALYPLKRKPVGDP